MWLCTLFGRRLSDTGRASDLRRTLCSNRTICAPAKSRDLSCMKRRVCSSQKLAIEEMLQSLPTPRRVSAPAWRQVARCTPGPAASSRRRGRSARTAAPPPPGPPPPLQLSQRTPILWHAIQPPQSPPPLLLVKLALTSNTAAVDSLLLAEQRCYNYGRKCAAA